jgi:Domain of unknown function (DUF222)
MDSSRGASGSVDGSLPAGLAEMAPGPELAAVLESVDHAAVEPQELEVLLQARARQIWHLQAEQMIDLYLTAQAVRRRIGMSEQPKRARRHTFEYVGWQMRCSARWAQQQLDLAETLLTQLPDVFDEVSVGRLDPARAKAFVELLSGVEDDATVRWILDRLLPKAPEWTLPQLRERLRYHVDRKAPESARRRYQQRVADRGVELKQDPDGTATLCAAGLAPHRAAAAYDRLDRLARAARCAGDARSLPQLRADAFTDTLTGTPFDLAPTVDPLTAEADAHHPRPDAGDEGKGGAPGNDGPAGAGPRGPVPPEPLDDADCPPDEQDGEPSVLPTDVDRHPEPQWWTACATSRPTETPVNSRSGNGNPDRVLAGDRCSSCGQLLPRQRRGAVEVAVKLTTLLGHDDHPALIGGVGSVLADIARQLAHDPDLNPVWRWSVFDQHGDLLHHGCATHRPTPTGRSDSRSQTRKTGPLCTCPRLQPGERRSIIELQLTPTDLSTDCTGTGWEALVADIATQVAADQQANPPGKWSEVDEHGRLRHHGHTGRHPNTEGAGLRRACEPNIMAVIRARDRTCRAPGCRRCAATCDLDHSIEHRNHGPAHRGNCRCLCRIHHTMRHTPGVHVTEQTTDHGRVTTWALPDGHTYHVTREKDIILTLHDTEPCPVQAGSGGPRLFGPSTCLACAGGPRRAR